MTKITTTLSAATPVTVGQATDDVLPARGQVTLDTLSAAGGATGTLGALSR